MPKYGPKAQNKVEHAVKEMKEGKLKSGSGHKVTSRKQAVAIGLLDDRPCRNDKRLPKEPSINRYQLVMDPRVRGSWHPVRALKSWQGAAESELRGMSLHPSSVTAKHS